ncbi:MAG TPA: hypothetical protein VLC91_17400 [Spongiibacteraceae bacterium]|nr:hypothetical protein [Spongiibacteraceae bacterium]
MNRFVSSVSIALALCSFSACNAKDPSQPKPPTPQTGGVIPQAQLDALNKAKNVENVLQQEAHQRSEQADQ